MEKRKAVFSYDYGAENMKKIEDLGFEILYSDENNFHATPEMLDAEFIVCFNIFDRINYHEMKNLKWVQLVSKGINHVPEDLRNGDVIITNNSETTSVPIGEWIVTFILEIFKDTRGFIRKQDKALWSQNQVVLDLYGKTVGIIGTGRIAREAAKRLKAFECRVIGVNHTGSAKDNFDKVYSIEELDQFWPQCDAIVSTLPATPETFHLINEESIAKMKDGVALVNISRGSIIDTEALMKANRAGKFLGIALDVFEQEPLPADHPLWKMENVIITPHNVMWSDNYYQRCFEAVYNNCRHFAAGEPLDDVADFVKGY